MGIYDYNAVTLDGEERSLADFKGKVLLIVNTASKCGFTPQYKGLQALYQRYKDRGLVVLGFPCNQFGHQEPGDEVEIGAFCEKNYGVDFEKATTSQLKRAACDFVLQHCTRLSAEGTAAG